MEKLIERFAKVVKGSMTGFDRIVFKGIIKPLVYARGATNFCWANDILNKNYKKWMLKQTETLVETVDQYAKKNCGQGIIPLKTWRIRKEAEAHKRQQTEQIDEGLIGVWSCLEAGSSYRAVYCAKAGYPQLQNCPIHCKHLYFYFDHEEFGFMNIRLQTWFPYHIQICMNGREWLRRSLERLEIDFLAKKNKFLHISGYEEAQSLLDSQLDTRWADMLDGFLPTAFPTMREILGPNLSYYWTMWQSEWATDLIFNSPDSLNSIMESLLRHAHMTGTSTRVLRYLDRPLNKNEKPSLRSKDEVYTKVTDFNDGLRLRHWIDSNSVKVYNEQNVLRVETTINKPDRFRVYRHKQGQSPEEPKTRLPMRKGVADIPLRAKVSHDVNQRFMNDLAALGDDTPVYELIDEVTRFHIRNGRRVRALDPTGKDRELIQLISDPVFRVSGLTNKMLRERLRETHWASGRTDKQLSARISRQLRLLRDHGIIRKLPRQNKYLMTIKGGKLANVLNSFLAASTEKLLKMAA